MTPWLLVWAFTFAYGLVTCALGFLVGRRVRRPGQIADHVRVAHHDRLGYRAITDRDGNGVGYTRNEIPPRAMTDAELIALGIGTPEP